jgi:hypothetical protein
MRILCVSWLRSASDFAGSRCTALNRRLAECQGVDIVHLIAAPEGAIDALLARTRLLPIAGRLVQCDAMVNVIPIVPPRAHSAAFDRRLRAAVLDARPDIVHVWGGGQPFETRALQIARGAGVATALTFDADDACPRGSRLRARGAAASVDLLFATSDRAAKELAASRPDLVAPVVNTDFWSPARVRPADARTWSKVSGLEPAAPWIACPVQSDDRAGCRFALGVVRQLARRAGSSARMPPLRLAIVLAGGRSGTLDRSSVERLAVEYGVRHLTTIVGPQPPALLRPFFETSVATLHVERHLGFGLESMLMGGVPVAARDSALAAYLHHGVDGFVYGPRSEIDAADALEQLAASGDTRASMAKAAQVTAGQFGAARQAPAYVKLFRTIVGPGRPRGRRERPVRSSQPMDWVRQTVLSLDLDLTLIRPTPAFESRPTPFPLPPAAEVSITCDLGRRYTVRPGLDALERILQWPWKAKILCSMSSQDKVDEAARCIRIGSRPLAEWMDACVGSELLNAFADARRVALPFYRPRALSNPHGRLVRAKPSQFLQLVDIEALGRALRRGDREAAGRIAATGTLRNCRGLLLDDQPYAEPATPEIAAYRVLPFLDIEDFEEICEKTDQNAPLIFNYLDHTWRAVSAPFHYLAHLLDTRPTWPQFRQRLNTEYELTDALRHAENIRQFRWMRRSAEPCLPYGKYLETRRDLDRALDAARHREQARVYRTIADDLVGEDVRQGWDVLFLGRDMDYAFQFVRHLYPGLVRQRRVALLPLSRTAIQRVDDEVLVRLLRRTFPGLQSGARRGIRLYDVGFHGRIPSHIARTLERFGWTLTKRVEARLLNACSCATRPNGACAGEPIRFTDWRGSFTVSRSFGIAIERSPHRTGPLETIARRGDDAVFRFGAHGTREAKLAADLETFMAREALEGRARLPNQPDEVRFVGYHAWRLLEQRAPRDVRLLRRHALSLRSLSACPQSEAVAVVAYPFCGTDLLTPFVCFPNLSHLLLIDQIPASPDSAEVDPRGTAMYLAELMTLFGPDFVQPTRHLSRVRRSWATHVPSIDESHARALVSARILLSLARLLPEGHCVTDRPRSKRPSDAPAGLSWAVRVEDRTIRVDYFTCKIGADDGEVRDHVRRALDAGRSALILKGVAQLLPGEGVRTIGAWSRAASVLLHDARAAARLGLSDGAPGLLGDFESVARASTRRGRDALTPPANAFHLIARR